MSFEENDVSEKAYTENTIVEISRAEFSLSNAAILRICKKSDISSVSATGISCIKDIMYEKLHSVLTDCLLFRRGKIVMCEDVLDAIGENIIYTE